MLADVYVTKKRELCQALSEWLDQFEWDWWATFTFQDGPKGRSPENAKRHFWRFLRCQEKAIKDWIQVFFVIEWHKGREYVHIHALLGRVKQFRRLDWMDDWYDKFGIARIYPYQLQLGARYYLGKYLIKELADWDFQMQKVQKIQENQLTFW